MKYPIAIALLFSALPASAADYAAVLGFSRRVELGVPVSGIVEAVYVDVGAAVKKGEVLLRLDARRLEAQVAESEAALSRLAAEAADAAAELARAEELYGRTVLSTSELDQARLRDAKARAAVSEARARRDQRRKELEDSALRAPFDGVVLARRAEPGQAVAAELRPPVLMVLAKRGEMVARAHVPPAAADRLAPGQPVVVVIGDVEHDARVRSVGLEPATREELTYPVDAVFSVTPLPRAGSPAILRVP